MEAKILIVDDLPENMQIIVSVFEKYKSEYQLYGAPNGAIAFTVAKKVNPDIIITDWDMPQMNGIELIKKLKKDKELKNIPVIMATGVMTSVEYLQTALKAGAVDYVKKPIDEVELVARTESALNLARQNRELLEKKNQELVENTLFLIRNNEFNKKMTIKMQSLLEIISKENSEAILLVNMITKSIDEKVKTDSWKRFEIAFNSVYDDFYNNLLLDFPKLSPSEMKICAFLKLGMTSKDIASVLFITPDSVKVARSRLRKKLHLKAETNLQIFLANY